MARFSQIIKNCSQNEILPLIRDKISKDSTSYKDSFKTYDSVVDMVIKNTIESMKKNEPSKKERKVKNSISMELKIFGA